MGERKVGCDKCHGGFIFTDCCSGLSEQCLCMGYPVTATNCKNCNPDNQEPIDPYIKKLLSYSRQKDCS